MAHFIPFPDKFHLADEYMRVNVPLEASDCPLKTECRLAFYSLRQQALHGENRTSAPSRWSITERAKWDAWASLGRMSQLEAMVFFVQLVEKEVDPDWLSKVAPPPPPEPEPEPTVSDKEEVVDATSSAVEDLRHPIGQKPATEEEMWSALQSAWQRLEALATTVKGRDQTIADLRDQLHMEKQASEMLRQQNGMLQAQLQEVIRQQNAEGRAKLVPKRRTNQDQAGRSEANGGHVVATGNGAEKAEEESPTVKPTTPTFDPTSTPSASPSDARIVNYYYSSDASPQGWWGWLRPW
eukprot:EG_transcript_17773